MFEAGSQCEAGEKRWGAERERGDGRLEGLGESGVYTLHVSRVRDRHVIASMEARVGSRVARLGPAAMKLG